MTMADSHRVPKNHFWAYFLFKNTFRKRLWDYHPGFYFLSSTRYSNYLFQTLNKEPLDGFKLPITNAVTVNKVLLHLRTIAPHQISSRVERQTRLPSQYWTKLKALL